MSNTGAHRLRQQIIEAEKTAYLKKLPPPDPSWPPDVQVMFDDLRAHLFEKGVTIEAVKERCGIGNNNIASRFRHFVGRAPKKFVLHHRMELAERLLEYETLTITQVAFAVGYASPNGFSMTFKRQVGVSPTAFRQDLRRGTGREL